MGNEPIEEYVHIPLVIYVAGERHVVGEATLRGSNVTGVFSYLGGDANVGEKVLSDIFATEDAEFSLDRRIRTGHRKLVKDYFDNWPLRRDDGDGTDESWRAWRD